VRGKALQQITISDINSRLSNAVKLPFEGDLVKIGSGELLHKTTMRKLASALMGLALLAVPAAAEACRVFIPIEQRIERWYDDGLIDTVFIAEVTSVQRIDGFPAQEGQWAKRLRVVETVRGQPLAQTHTLSEDIFISSCGWVNNVKAQVGDRVVFYMIRNAEDELEAFLAMPLVEARQVDSSLSELSSDD